MNTVYSVPSFKSYEEIIAHAYSMAVQELTHLQNAHVRAVIDNNELSSLRAKNSALEEKVMEFRRKLTEVAAVAPTRSTPMGVSTSNVGAVSGKPIAFHLSDGDDAPTIKEDKPRKMHWRTLKALKERARERAATRTRKASLKAAKEKARKKV
jgi:hypothetical protein